MSQSGVVALNFLDMADKLGSTVRLIHLLCVVFRVKRTTTGIVLNVTTEAKLSNARSVGASTTSNAARKMHSAKRSSVLCAKYVCTCNALCEPCTFQSACVLLDCERGREIYEK